MVGRESMNLPLLVLNFNIDHLYMNLLLFVLDFNMN